MVDFFLTSLLVFMSALSIVAGFKFYLEQTASDKLFFRLLLLLIISFLLIFNLSVEYHNINAYGKKIFMIIAGILYIFLPIIIKYDLKYDCDEFNNQKYGKYINILIFIYYLILVFFLIIIAQSNPNDDITSYHIYWIFIFCMIIFCNMFMFNRFYICTTKINILIRIYIDVCIIMCFLAYVAPTSLHIL